jgi:phage/plasmid-associated DNA primase
VYTIVTGDTRAQVFFYIFGPAASGKSVFSQTVAALLPEQVVVTTTLRDLAKDKFEVVNLGNKMLVTLADAEDFTGELSVLKAFVGQDTLKGSRKHVQGTVQITPVGLMMIVANHPFSATRDSGALGRRLWCFMTGATSKNRDPMIVRHADGT